MAPWTSSELVKLGSLAGMNACAVPQSLPVPTVRLPPETEQPDHETGFLPSQSVREPFQFMYQSELQDLYSRTNFVTFHRVRPSVPRDSSI
jgi:hypothetical protein